MLAFVGRIQPLKAPDVLLRAAAKLPTGSALRVLVAGGPSGSGLAAPTRWFGSPTNWVSPPT